LLFGVSDTKTLCLKSLGIFMFVALNVVK